MKKNLRNKLFVLLALLLPLSFPACRDKHPEHAENGVEYTCPMHPQIVRDKPGDCPICGMRLVPKNTEAPADVPAVTGDLNYLLRPVNQTVVSSIKTTKPVEKAMEREITMTGIITPDTRRQFTIPARFGGRIEKLYVQFDYQSVRKGQRLYDIYSPELLTAQRELVYLVKNDAANTELIQSAKQKLRYLGATDAQINQLVRTGRELYTFPVYSPYSGYVVDPSVTTAPTYNPGNATAASGAGMGSMGSMSGNTGASGSTLNTAAPTPTQGFSVREGMYVTTGQSLFKVINTEQVWAEFNVNSSDAAQLQKGMPLTVMFNQLPTQSITTKVDLVQPFYGANENFAKVRALLPAQDKLTLVGQLVTGKASYATGTTLWVPKSAVLDLGTTSVAFLKQEGFFKPINITTGQQANGLIEVQDGLSAQSEIAANAQFMVDSESFVRVAGNKL